MGVDTEYFKPDDRTEMTTDLLFTGNFDNAQNVDSVQYFYEQIWLIIKRRKPDINLQIVGYKSDERLGFLENRDGIKVLGYVDDIRNYIAQAKVFIMPARTGGGMRGKLLEALSMAKPVVSSSMGAQGYEGKLHVSIKIADTPGEFAETILTLLDDEALRNRLGDYGRSVVEKDYDWNAVFGRMDEIYGN
jgi:glycosyltransferase involved in cell wall biosynthesis